LMSGPLLSNEACATFDPFSSVLGRCDSSLGDHSLFF
jgi:hypothetical protein